MNNQGAKILSVVLLFLAATSVKAQVQDELKDPYPGSQLAWSQLRTALIGWGSVDERYSRSQVPTVETRQMELTAWRGERVHAQAFVASPGQIDRVSLSLSSLKSGRDVLPSDGVRLYQATYVMADNFARSDSVLVPDRLVESDGFAVAPRTTRPVWLSIQVPQSAKAGRYKGYLSINCNGREHRLPLTLRVIDRVLPVPAEWSFHLDLWQNPYAVARYYDVPLWSQQHFDLMRPVMQTLAAAGQKVITCSIIQHPWNSQTLDPFESMIGKRRTVDGSWLYDYTVFDRWVEFMMSLGINRQIDCYTLVPWHYRFDYFDMASNTVRYVNCQPGDPDYEAFLQPFLKDFAAHLKSKGWFEKTCIAIDERPTDQLRAAYEVVKRADPGYRMEGAYNYFPEFFDEVHDISVSYDYDIIHPEAIVRRHENGQPVTFYTCCVPDRPNTFTFSPTAESAYMGWHAAAVGYDGYLRWAYNSWVARPNLDSRFRSWPSGDCFLVYPDGTSMRMERLVEGIQAFEKIRILRARADEKTQQKLDEILRPFAETSMPADVDVAEMVGRATRLLNGI
ncbi:MAG: DUF4091 domain-containing protein [Prevotella sp.]|nr:DUF4091 domain-containing protein [Prevotella sp.]